MTARDEILAAVRSLTRRSGRATFSVREVVDELRRRGSSYAESTIRTHVVSRMCANAPENHGTVYTDLERVSRGVYQLRNG